MPPYTAQYVQVKAFPSACRGASALRADGALCGEPCSGRSRKRERETGLSLRDASDRLYFQRSQVGWHAGEGVDATRFPDCGGRCTAEDRVFWTRGRPSADPGADCGCVCLFVFVFLVFLLGRGVVSLVG